jgi:hypothetical protein
MIERALAHGDGNYALEDVLALVSSGEAQLWVSLDQDGIEAACVTTIVDYPRRKACLILFLGGTRLKHWLEFEAVIAAWAKAQGCDCLEGYGREGWTKVLKDWRKTHVVIRKDI